MTVADLVRAIEAIAPTSHAEPWDNVGLILGDPDAPLKGPVLLTIDLTEDVLEEAVKMGSGAVVAYHPVIFHALKRITAADAKGRVLLGALARGIAVYSPHTALDAAPGGMSDWLCEALLPKGGNPASLGDRRALRAAALNERTQTHKIVTFVPAEHVERVRNGLALAGAGHIGAYELCTFNIEGRGTFYAGEGSRPTVGKPGRLETVDEVRLEMVCPEQALALAHEMLRQFHPYDEPAWEIYQLVPKPDRSIGAGRRITLDQPATPAELVERIKRNLGLNAVKLAAASGKPVKRVGVCPGAGASLVDAAIEDGCEVFFTGEMTHHEAAAALARGCSIILAGHTNTERPYLPILAERLAEAIPGAKPTISKADGPIFRTL